MFCTKCEKEIDDNVKFCKYCSSPDEEDTEALPDMDTAEDAEVSDEPVLKPKNRKRWVVPVCIAAGIAVLGGRGVLAANMAKAEKETEVVYPKDIILEAEVQNKVTELLDLLSKVDASGSGHNFAIDRTIDSNFASIFLLESMWFDVPFIDGQPVEGWSMPEDTVRKYLNTSIGVSDCTSEGISISEGVLLVEPVQVTGVYGNDTPQITKVTQLSDTDIQVSGSVNYIPEFEMDQPYTADFDVTLTVNPDSMWGGYALKSIDKWEEASKPSMETVTKQDFNLSSSSTLQQTGYDYSVASLADGNTQTCWAEGVSGIGEGEIITFSSDETKTVSGLAILPGYLKSEDLFYKNGMPLAVKITSGDKYWIGEFQDFRPNFSSPMDSMVFIDFGEGVDMNECTVTLTGCKSGNKYDDICITEMFLYKK